MKQIVNEQVNDKLSAALKSTNESKIIVEEEQEDEAVEYEGGIITTEEELESYAITKVALKGTIDSERVFYRDNKSYFNILIDDNIRKWIIRVFFERNRNYIQLNDGPTAKDRTLIFFEQPINPSYPMGIIISMNI